MPRLVDLAWASPMSALPNEYTKVEQPLIHQLKHMGWKHLVGNTDDPTCTDRQSFREVLLTRRLRQAIHRINLDDDGQPWLDASRISTAIAALERLGNTKLMEANQQATDLLLNGTVIEGDPERHGDRAEKIKFIDFDHPERNDFLVINQFRVDPPWSIGEKNYIIPDLVLFVNGIPLVVIECKSPAATDPIQEAITQLLRYSNQRDWVEENEGAERLFHYNQFIVASSWYKAVVGTISAHHEHYLAWKDTSPIPMAQVAADPTVERLSAQQTLVAGMLHPSHLLDITRNFTLFQQSAGQTVKIVCRYQQFRAVQAATRRLQNGQTRQQHGESDQRGGIIWHTQGSGKSLTMVFLVRTMRTLPELRRYKIVVVTDRTDLEKQLSETATLTGETVRKATSTSDLQTTLREPGADLVFAMIQKYQQRDEDEQNGGTSVDFEAFPVLNESESILVLVDEAHRSQASQLHANLMKALPNCAKIGFTGTPILAGDRKRTYEIFGEFIDRYTIQQSEADGATVPILYEGRTADADVDDERSLNQLFEDMFRDRTPKELAAIQKKYATTGNVLEAPKLIAAKAADMLRHYVSTILPNGFKAQVVAVSRLAAIRYQQALVTAHQDLIARLEQLDASLLNLEEVELEHEDAETQFLVRAARHLDTIRRLEFAAVISGSHNDDPAWKVWSEKSKTDTFIKRFKKPLHHPEPTKRDGLAFLCVKSMLLTGFDAPIEQVLYLDRSMQGPELLQAIARVNRTYSGKAAGYVVDYYGVAQHLKEALEVYSAEDIQGALVSIQDELPKLRDRHQRVLAIFYENEILDIANIDACVDLLRDTRLRADFVVKLKVFLESLDIVLPRPEALPYFRDAKLLGFINKSAANLYRDEQLDIIGAGQKVRELIDQYIIASGVDPKIPPISILDTNFEKTVEAKPSNRAKAAEMEHAARYHISKHFQEDPTYYQRLSERLEEILTRFENHWDEQATTLWELTKDIRQGRQADETGLDPRTQAPFLDLLKEEASSDGELSPEQLKRLTDLTVEIVEHIREEIRMIDFWRNTHAQTLLRGWIVQFLDDHDVVPFTKQQAVSDRVVQLAKALHSTLTS